MESIKNFEQFFESKKLYEMNLPVMKLTEIIDDVTVISDNTLKKVLVSFFKTYDEYIDV